jgi:uncharacterized membrane protein YfcA
MTLLQICLVGGAVFAGAVTQRLTGLGFAMVASPLLILVLGPFQGVLLANILTFTLTVIMIGFTWRQAELGRLALLIPTSLLAALLGGPVARHIPPAWLLTISGALVLGALLLVMSMKNLVLFRGHPGAGAAGLISGFMNATAGVGGPAITLYALSISWEQTSFYASMQIYLAALNFASFITKGAPHLPLSALLVVIVMLAGGFWSGRYVARIVPLALARKLVVLLALAGSAATLIKGLSQLAG